MGSMNDKLRCCKEVRGSGTYGWLHPAQCQKPVKVTVDGKHYCATHNPEAKARREKASEDRYNAKNAAYEAERQAQKEQARRAACFDSLVAALGGVDELCQAGLNSPEPKHWEAALQDIMESVREALNEARNKS